MSSLTLAYKQDENTVKSLLKSSILLIPAVSAGNIPQLTADLLIYSYKMHLVGRLDSQYLYPVAGPRDWIEGEPNVDKTGVSTPIEVYTGEGAGKGVTVVQIRSPTLPGYRKKFVQETLLEFVKEYGFAEILVIGSSNAGLRNSMQGPRFKTFSHDLSQRLGRLSLDAVEPPEQLPESGIVLDVLNDTDNTSTFATCAIVLFSYEGDNIGDAEELADQVVTLLGQDPAKFKASLSNGAWVRPQSWNGIYGKSVPIGLEQGLYS